ncbi:Cytochrome c oxidase assembly factor 5 [Holothuria leucospilota]|uniref:Cytochrome c oxidase assembly factor 5 n=1 Tax=Holothuria leucospilota TaxID=206669 RepID=A0A9Q1BL64_HOLLE|nr:Cytochrome c oxidase assembly factor 5 [Holothuria leucospilota]
MPKYYEDKPESKRPCEGLKEDLKSCLLESDCVRLDKKTPKECLQKGTRVDQSCRALQTSFFECKRSLLDTRTRFRGRKGY